MGTWDNLMKSAESFLNEDDEATLPQSEDRARRRRDRYEEGNGNAEQRSGDGNEARDLESGGEFWGRSMDLESGAYYDGVRFLAEKGDGGWLD